MAEFMEVALAKKRMCKSYAGCRGCPLENTNLCLALPVSENIEKLERIEKVVVKWAAEHPEPVYPTFADWLYESFLKWCQANHPGRAKDENAWFDYLYETRIPAEIAEKLGIQPKEG